MQDDSGHNRMNSASHGNCVSEVHFREEQHPGGSAKVQGVSLSSCFSVCHEGELQVDLLHVSIPSFAY